MITATIQSIIAQGAQIIVTVLFSNIIVPQVYTFGPNDTPDSISARIQGDLDGMNASAYQLSLITSALAAGTVFQTSPQTQASFQATLDTAIPVTTSLGVAIVSQATP